MVDPDCRVAGEGLSFLRRQGIKVDVGIESEKCMALNKAYIYRVLNNRPYHMVDGGAIYKLLLDLCTAPQSAEYLATTAYDMALLQRSISGDIDTIHLTAQQFLDLFQDANNFSRPYAGSRPYEVGATCSEHVSAVHTTYTHTLIH